jgi:cytochrome c553
MNKLFKKLCFAAGLFGAMSVMANAAGNVDAGRDKTAVCAGCHGADGNSAMGNFPKLAGQGEKYLVKQMDDVKGGLRVIPEMTGLLDNLSDKDIEDIAAFYAAQKVIVSQAKPETVELGRALFRSGNAARGVAACAGCHGPAGLGIALASYPALGGQHAAYIAKQLYAFRKGERANDGDTRIMRSVAARLSDDEIDALANYISGLEL